MSRYSLPVATLDKIMNYLGAQPFVEVAPLIQEVQKEATLVDETPEPTTLPPAPDDDE